MSDKIITAGRFCSGIYFLIRGIWIAQADVLFESAVKQEIVLRHETNQLGKLGYGCGLLVILSVLVVGFSKQLSGLFVRSSDVAVIVGIYFLIVSIGYVLNTVTNCYLGALNGMGKPSKSMFLMIFYYIVVRIPLAYLLSYLGFGLNGIWVAVLVSHIVASFAAAITGTVFIRKKGNIKA